MLTNPFFNITLIGMAGAGKSTTGIIIARLAGKKFQDTDEIITRLTGISLHKYLNSVGRKQFLKTEERALLDIHRQNNVISTGGSAIYSKVGLDYLQSTGPVVLLNVSLQTLKKRIINMDNRGLVSKEGQNFSELFAERLPLYQSRADIIIAADTASPEKVAEKTITAVQAFIRA